MSWILIIVTLNVVPISKQTIGYYPDLESCQEERGKLFWITPTNSKTICVKNEEILKTREHRE